ncbi:amidase [Castellaniella sp. S9]|uniref:amidase n=1 Tax=Castellaniella sp. S9 TaxID=2993652 RepID=UPI0022B3F73A|nr:amidase [Castellaniella sp. S9]
MSVLNTMSATEAAAAIAAREISSVELVEACLTQIEKREPIVGAWVCFDREQALRAARECDATPPKGLLHGIPIGIKDNIDTRNFPTEYGSRIYSGHQPQRDAACIGLATRAGGIIMGKTVTTEFAMFEPNKTANPLNPSHTPGGSSSGSAAAVADFQVPIALATQSAGSIIRPSAYCGVIGYKPSLNTFAPDGIKPIGASLDTLGAITRTIDDHLLMWSVLQGMQSVQAPPVPARLRVGMCRTPFWHQAAPEQRTALERAGARLSRENIEVEEVELPAWFDSLNDLHGQVMAYEVARNHAFEFDAARRDLLGMRTRSQFELGWKLLPEDYLKARAVLHRARNEFDVFCKDFHVMMVPAAPGEAPLIQSTGDPIFNSIWTLLGVPALTLPVGLGKNGLPVAVQFVSGMDTDLFLLAACRKMEALFKEKMDCS